MTPSIQLTTTRLTLRTPGEGDVAAVFALMSDAETARNVGFRPMAHKSEAEGKIRRAMAGQLMFVIEESGPSGGVVGVIEAAPHVANTTDGVAAASFQVDFGTAVGAAALLAVLGMMAGLAPAWRAMKVKPVDAMREQG